MTRFGLAMAAILLTLAPMLALDGQPAMHEAGGKPLRLIWSDLKRSAVAQGGGFDSYAAHHFPALRTASVLICALACFGYACSSMNRATPSAARDVLPVTEYIVRAFNRDMAVAIGCHRIRRRGPSVGVRGYLKSGQAVRSSPR